MTTRRTFLATLTAVSLAPALAKAGAARTGKFTGPKRYGSGGAVEVTNTTVALQRDFSLSRGPDPVVGLGKNGRYDPATFMGELKAKKGAQSYAIPSGINVADYDEVHIWCRRFNTGLGVARL